MTAITTNPNMASNLTLGKTTEGISLGLVATITAVAIASFYGLGFLAQMIATPIFFGIATGVAIHIVLYGPKESMECVERLLGKIPSAAEAIVEKAPVVFEQLRNLAVQMAHRALQYIGSKVNPPSTEPYTLGEVASGLGREGVNAAHATYQKVSPIAIESGKKGVQYVQEKVSDGTIFVVQKCKSKWNDLTK